MVARGWSPIKRQFPGTSLALTPFPFVSFSVAGKQKRSPTEEAPYPKRGKVGLLDTSCQMTGQLLAWYGNQNPVNQFAEKVPSGTQLG